MTTDSTKLSRVCERPRGSARLTAAHWPEPSNRACGFSMTRLEISHCGCRREGDASSISRPKSFCPRRKSSACRSMRGQRLAWASEVSAAGGERAGLTAGFDSAGGLGSKAEGFVAAASGFSCWPGGSQSRLRRATRLPEDSPAACVSDGLGSQTSRPATWAESRSTRHRPFSGVTSALTPEKSWSANRTCCARIKMACRSSWPEACADLKVSGRGGGSSRYWLSALSQSLSSRLSASTRKTRP